MTKDEIKEAVKEALAEHEPQSEKLLKAGELLKKLVELSAGPNNRYMEKEYKQIVGKVYQFLYENGFMKNQER